MASELRAARSLTPAVVASSRRLTSLFTGIGGLDLGMVSAGFEIAAMCEIWEPARLVLRQHWPTVVAHGDVERLPMIPDGTAGIIAGFPCTNLSLAGAREGIGGPASRLVSEVLRLATSPQIEWVLLENVATLLSFGGAPMRMIVGELERLGYSWAYRVVDARFTGLPQRRPRVLLLAARTFAPEHVLLADDAGEPGEDRYDDRAFGFYWTEGRRGLGWTRDAIPPLKGGSTIGIPSAPGVWLPSAPHGLRIVTPTIEHGEVLQGFARGWTQPAAADPTVRHHRWKLVGNAVAVPVAAWIGGRLTEPGAFTPASPREFQVDRAWPAAGWGAAGRAWTADISKWPEHLPYTHLADIVTAETAIPLSHRAAVGFLRRLEESRLRLDPAFVADVHLHIAKTRSAPVRRPTRAASVRTGGRQRPLRAADRAAQSWATDAATRHRMQANRANDTTPEMALRRELFGRGLRYRLQQRIVPGTTRTVDIAFPGQRVAVDVRGCFWHACPLHVTLPKSNADHWLAKLRRTVERDADTVQRLRDAGWATVVVWEHEGAAEAADRVQQALISTV